MPEDMPDRMPNRMSEDMSDRMPEDLPVRKCINVMVWITRSKVIWGMKQTNSTTLAAKGLGTLHLGVGAGQKLCKGGGRTEGICLS